MNLFEIGLKLRYGLAYGVDWIESVESSVLPRPHLGYLGETEKWNRNLRNRL